MYHIILSEHFGGELRSRTKAERLRQLIEQRADTETEIVLDYTDVEFISRSFADEVYTITTSVNGLRFQTQNAGVMVADMINAVAQSRQRQRIRILSDSTIKHARNMAELRRILAML